MASIKEEITRIRRIGITELLAICAVIWGGGELYARVDNLQDDVEEAKATSKENAKEMGEIKQTLARIDANVQAIKEAQN